MVLKEAAGDLEMCTLSSVGFVVVGNEIGKPVGILSSIDVGGVWMIVVLAVTKG